MNADVPGELTGVLTSGRPASELSDSELEGQGTQAHATRNWVFLHGTAEQFARHTSRMLELEQEYLRRHPHRTWQGSGGVSTSAADEASALRSALRAIVGQLAALAADPVGQARPRSAAADPAVQVLAAVAAAPHGRLHKLEVHQAAREAGLDRASLAMLYTAAEPLLVTDHQERVITEAGLRRLRESGWTGGAAGPGSPRAGQAVSPDLDWQHEQRSVWDEDKQRVIGAAEPGVFDLHYLPGELLPGDWWSVLDGSGRVLAFGWMDVTWGEAEILLAVEPGAREAGIGSFVLDNLEREAAARGVNYVYNTVADTHPDRDSVHDWLGVRGYRNNGAGGVLRKRVPTSEVQSADVGALADRPVAGTGGSDLGPGREDSGGYVDVEDHQY